MGSVSRSTCEGMVEADHYSRPTKRYKVRLEGDHRKRRYDDSVVNGLIPLSTPGHSIPDRSERQQ